MKQKSKEMLTFTLTEFEPIWMSEDLNTFDRFVEWLNTY